MNEYHKIQTVFLRDPATNHKTLLQGNWALPEFEYLSDNEWTFTEKVDGTNIRIMFDGNTITFGGKPDSAQIPKFLLTILEGKFLPLEAQFREAFPNGVCLYGEGYGAKIQKGGENYCGLQDFVLFDVKIGEWWLQRHGVSDIGIAFGIDVVPIIGVGTLHDMVVMVRDGFTSQWGDFIAEGIVARPALELKSRNGSRIITKLKYKDFPRSQR